MRTINILNAGSTDVYYKGGDIVNISSKREAYKGRYYVEKVFYTENTFDVTILINERLSNTKIDDKTKKYKSTFIKSHKKVW